VSVRGVSFCVHSVSYLLYSATRKELSSITNVPKLEKCAH